MKIALSPKRIKYMVRSWIETRIRAQYFPYKPYSLSYMLAREEPHDAPVCEQGLPVPPQDLWWGYGATVEEHLASGKRDVSRMLEIAREAGVSFEEGGRILDVGCAAGRMLRWLKALAPNHELWGCDISSRHIIWCKRHLPAPFRFFTATTIPHLPIEDAYFTFIYAGSLFTHIDDLADAWFLELRRVLAPGGRLYITIHDHDTIRLFNTTYRDHELVKREFLSNKSYVDLSASDFDMFTVGRATNSQVFYDPDYLSRQLQQYFKVLSITPEAYGWQTALLLEKI